MNKAGHGKIKAARNIYDFLEEIIMLFAIHLATWLPSSLEKTTGLVFLLDPFSSVGGSRFLFKALCFAPKYKLNDSCREKGRE